MRRDRQTGWVRGLLAAVAVATAVTVAVPSGASAQCAATAMNCTLVRPDGKGIIGLGLIGAELGLIIPAIAGVRDEWWPYVVFPLIGAVGGAIGGWAVEQNTQADPEVDVALMAVGMVLIVPTIVGTLALTAYQPPPESAEADEDYEPEDIIPEDSVEAVHDGSGDTAPADEAAPAEGGSSDEFGGATSRHETENVTRMRSMLAGGRGLLRFVLGEPGGAQALLGLPLPYSASSYTAEERARMLLNPSTDFIVPVVSATF